VRTLEDLVSVTREPLIVLGLVKAPQDEDAGLRVENTDPRSPEVDHSGAVCRHVCYHFGCVIGAAGVGREAYLGRSRQLTLATAGVVTF
jgi:hypothetical protein